MNRGLTLTNSIDEYHTDPAGFDIVQGKLELRVVDHLQNGCEVCYPQRQRSYLRVYVCRHEPACFGNIKATRCRARKALVWQWCAKLG
jgi:hypothetical protein